MKNVFWRIVFGIVVVVGLPLALSSCLNEGDQYNAIEQLLADTKTIDDYLASNHINAVEDPSGLRMAISVIGTGFPARAGSKVDVDYVGKLFDDGTTFDDGNIKIALQDLILGWRIALTTLPVGSKATVFVPSPLAYGNVDKQGIPPNSILIFDITFNEVIPTTTELQKLGSDTVAIDNYLTQKGIVAEKDTTGLRYVITELGAGTTPSWYDRVKFKASYRLLTDDTKVVHSYEYAPTEDFYSRVIDQIPDGLKQGLQKLPAGSKATFYLASGLAYGTFGASNGGVQLVPPNANIIIDVEFTEIANP